MARKAMTPFDFIDYCRSLGVDGAELTSYYFPSDVPIGHDGQAQAACPEGRCSISGGAIRNDFCQPEGPELDADLAHTKRCDRLVRRTGGLRHPRLCRETPQECRTGGNTRAMRQEPRSHGRLCRSKGVILALENHGSVTATADGLLTILKHAKSHGVAVNFDSGNFKSSADPYAELAQIAPTRSMRQIKVEMFPDVSTADRSQTRSLDPSQCGYSGWVALEYEAAEEPKEAIPRWNDELKKLMHA